MVSGINEPHLAIPAYDNALRAALSSIVEFVIDGDPLLGQISVRRSGHAGPARNVSGANPLDQVLATVEAELLIHQDVVRSTDIESFVGTALGAAKQFTDRLGTMFLQTLREVTEAEGTSIDAEGRPLTWDLFLDALEGIEFTFDRQGRPQPLQVIINPDTANRLLAIDITPDQRQRYETIVRTKRETWNAQKRARRLPRRCQGAGV